MSAEFNILILKNRSKNGLPAKITHCKIEYQKMQRRSFWSDLLVASLLRFEKYFKPFAKSPCPKSTPCLE